LSSDSAGVGMQVGLNRTDLPQNLWHTIPSRLARHPSQEYSPSPCRAPRAIRPRAGSHHPVSFAATPPRAGGEFFSPPLARRGGTRFAVRGGLPPPRQLRCRPSAGRKGVLLSASREAGWCQVRWPGQAPTTPSASLPPLLGQEGSSSLRLLRAGVAPDSLSRAGSHHPVSFAATPPRAGGEFFSPPLARRGGARFAGQGKLRLRGCPCLCPLLCVLYCVSFVFSLLSAAGTATR